MLFLSLTMGMLITKLRVVQNQKPLCQTFKEYARAVLFSIQRRGTEGTASSVNTL